MEHGTGLLLGDNVAFLTARLWRRFVAFCRFFKGVKLVPELFAELAVKVGGISDLKLEGSSGDRALKSLETIK